MEVSRHKSHLTATDFAGMMSMDRLSDFILRPADDELGNACRREMARRIGDEDLIAAAESVAEYLIDPQHFAAYAA